MSGDPSRVRVADERDEDELMRLCRSLWDENALFPMSDDKVRTILRGAISGPVPQRRGIVGVIGANPALEGAIYMELGSMWYSDEICLSEQFNFVLPQYRSSTNSKDLIAFAKRCSDQFNLPLLIGVLSNQRTEAKVRHYRASLGAPAGAFFLHNVSTGVH